MKTKTGSQGQVLVGVIVALTVLTIVVYALVNWSQTDSKYSVKQQKTTSAINFAEAGVDRGTWKLQSTTSTWAAAASGTLLPGYHFDSTYTDIPGGSYRIRFTPGPGTSEVTVNAEGRDSSTNEVRAISAVFKNQTIYSAMMSGGNVSWSQGLGIYWGPIISQGNIQLMDDNVARRYFPRKYAKGVVSVGPAVSAIYQRDTNGLLPPNTDNVEWWSEYAGVPNVPVLDFVDMRSSAAASGTLNVYGCQGTGAAWDNLRGTCNSAGSHNTHFGNSTNYIQTHSPPLDATKDYVWYWDGDVTLSGAFCGAHPCVPGQSTALRGTVIVRGNLTIDTPGDFVYTGPVPPKAWQEENKLLNSTFDSGNSQEYPADTGMHQSAATFNFGTDTWNEPGLSGGWYTTVGIRGFTYVGGNLNINGFMDFNGAVWVNGNVVSAYNDPSAFCGVFYDDSLEVPALNVILLRQSWQEVTASATAWP